MSKKQYRIMAIRWTPEEYEQLEQFAAEHELNATQYVRMKSLKLTAKKAIKPMGNPNIAEQAQAGGLARAAKAREEDEPDVIEPVEEAVKTRARKK